MVAFRWFQVVSRWFEVVSASFRWFQVVSGGFRLFVVLVSMPNIVLQTFVAKNVVFFILYRNL